MSTLNETALQEAIMKAGFTFDDEKSLIASNLHVTIFSALFTGIYTVIFGMTMYTYLKNGVRNRYLVPVTMSIVYLCNLGILGGEWYDTKAQFVDNGMNRDTIFFSIVDGRVVDGGMLEGFSGILNAITLALSDFLLIWRCFNIWDRSIRMITIPMLLTIVEAALMLSASIGVLIVPSTETSRLSSLNKAFSAGIIIAGCTTLISTALIAYRIHSFLKHQDILTKKFSHIMDIIIQSGALYSASILVLGVATVLNSSIVEGHPTVLLITFNFWANSIAFPLAGIATNVMVARVTTLSDSTNPSKSKQLTRIDFQHSTAQSAVQLSINYHSQNNSSREADGCVQDQAAKTEKDPNQQV
ncbi:hypothetical protein BDN70DRAFT_934497 [Pholiota conissans]|uniref:Uncharacterized protein n=1 Tax=Pholiota conissans TaxID=109636 RepID=A0A9P5YWP2_9AGAR|nr:hypothetical protein BDN70DRAFT_934497 [Pholiota conissans]